jgi:hypothetical protein
MFVTQPEKSMDSRRGFLKSGLIVWRRHYGQYAAAGYSKSDCY